MLVTKYVTIYINNYNKKKIENLFGYELDINLNTNIKIPTDSLPDGSGYKVEVICDFCGEKYENEWRKYLKIHKNNEKHCCGSKKCITEKRKESSFKNWGVDNPMKSNEVRSNLEKTNLEKWGVKHYSKTDEYKNKIKETAQLKWGVDHYSKTDEYKKKFKETSLKNWGVDNPSKSEEVKYKIKEVNLDKWGVDNYAKTDDFLNKVKSTSLDKWGVEYYSQSDECKEKVRLDSLDKWGVDNFNKTILSKNNKKIFSENYIEYLGNKFSKYKCDNGHYFEICSDNYLKRLESNINICTVCNPISELKSIKEKELFEFIKSNYTGDIIQSYRDSLEIDIYLPKINLGIEFNGLYYHSNKFKDKNYHLNKTKYFEERGIRIIHIWEDDWNYKKNIIMSQIKNWLNSTDNKIFARKCEVKEIKDSKIVSKFLNDNHIQGQVASSLKLGLYFKDELVSLMTFDHYEGRKKMLQNNWNINRFCNKLNYNIIGGASKLFKYFTKNYDVEKVISYSDKDWSLGELYKTLGFVKKSDSNPDYKYIIEGKRYHKSKFRKSKTGISESELEIIKIYDCGKIKWEIIV
jgi:very-short-patch-repair endonuclease